ncbi:MAG TPA: YdcF family protein [Bacillales bacterium]|nr:YdcF family protein [Bacillales bacterium]
MILVATMMLTKAGEFLVINEKPIKSDVIIMLSGGGIERLEKSVELYQQKYAPFLIISNGSEDNLALAAQTIGVECESLILENRAKSTRDNAFYTKELMEKYQFDSAIVVSSDYHMRRVKSNFAHAFRGSGIRLTYASASSPGYDPERWWSTKTDRRITVIEYIKLVGNFFGIHGKSAKEKLEELS